MQDSIKSTSSNTCNPLQFSSFLEIAEFHHLISSIQFESWEAEQFPELAYESADLKPVVSKEIDPVILKVGIYLMLIVIGRSIDTSENFIDESSCHSVREYLSVQ